MGKGGAGKGTDSQSVVHCSLQDVHACLMELQGIVEELLNRESYDSGSGKVTSLGPLVKSNPKPCFEVGSCSCSFRGPKVEGKSGKPNAVKGIHRAQVSKPKAQPKAPQ